MKKSKNIVTGIAVLVIVGISGFVFAQGVFGNRGYHMGMGSGGHMMGYDSYDSHMGDGGSGYHMGYGNSGRDQRFMDEQIEIINKARANFLKASNKLRNSIDQKRLELQIELIKENPDVNKLRKIQKDLSGLEAELDQKRLDYDLKISKMKPETNRGSFRRGYGQGFGGHHMGY